MPFWWRRRRKPWYTTWRNRRFRKYKRRNTYRRRKYRRPTRRRRRRRRRRKVRRKQKRITIKQWQPDSIRKCKIKGIGYLVAGAEGAQYRCYTNSKKEYTQPKAPGGGGFGLEVFTLEYLFKQWEAHKNIWTSSNDYKELVRYTGCKFTVFAHPTTDFIVSWDRQPPFEFTKSTYPLVHPQHMLLQKHHRVIPSVKYHPYGKKKYTFKIPPPKQMITKWFFQPDFADVNLLKIQASAMNLGYSLFGPNTQSTNATLIALNTNFYKNHNWAQNSAQIYLPYSGYPQTTGIMIVPYSGTKKLLKPENYQASVHKDTGFFQPAMLQAKQLEDTAGHKLFERPVVFCRYNPEEDTGKGNAVWFTSVISDHGWVSPTDQDLIIVEQPLYIAFFGFWDWIDQKKAKAQYFDHGMFVVKSPAIKNITPTTQTVWPLIDRSFMEGKMPYDELLTLQQINNWYPTAYKQVQTINAIIESGPYIPKYSNLPSSTWQLPYRYCFYFKWGGQQITDHLVQDPKTQDTYPVPDKLFQTIQIADPLKQHHQNILKSWDFRRGMLTARALKRIQENLQLDDSEQSDSSETEKKKRKVTSEIKCQDQEAEEMQSCLLSLCEKDSFPEQEDNLKQLIYQQYQQQQKLKHNIFQFLMYLKKKQRHLQMQTGLD
nr:MAG: ORF1 [Torque teno midi virus]